MSGLPSMLEFDNVKPRGFNSTFTRWEQYPQTTIQQNFNKNEVVRFLFQTDKFIDPYQSYIEIEVTSDVAPFATGTAQGSSTPILCLDGQSTSLISEMRIFSNSKEIERIQEYDQLGCILHDVNLQSGHKQSRGYEGMKYIQGGNYSTFNNWRQSTSSFQTPATPVGGAARNQLAFNFNTGVGPYNIPGWNYITQQNTFLHTLYGSQAVDSTSNIDIAMTADPNSFAAEYAFGFKAQTAIQGQNIYPQTNYGGLIGRQYNYGRCLLAYDSAYGIQGADQLTSSFNLGAGSLADSHYTGYFRPYAPYCSDDQVDMIIPGHEVLTIINGKFVDNTLNDPSVIQNLTTLNVQKTVNVKTYIVPILSGVLGILIPSEQWRLLPGSAFGQLMFEFYLNQHAFFYSSLKSSVTDASSITTAAFEHADQLQQWPMNWRVSKMSMHFDLWSFDQAVHQQINQALAGEGIVISSTSWTLGPTYSISNTQSVLNNWQINNGIPSIKMLFFWFLLNDYQSYNYCRKQYRVSQNITSIQLKVGQDYIPPTAILGHAGNIARNSQIRADNTNFLMELHRNSGCFFSASKGSKISAVEFAINERPYNITNSKDIANGASLFHETRCRGKALYTIDTTANPHDSTVLSGLDTTQKRPIELVLNADGDNGLQRPSTMYVMFQHDFMVILRSDGVQTMGSG